MPALVAVPPEQGPLATARRPAQSSNRARCPLGSQLRAPWCAPLHERDGVSINNGLHPHLMQSVKRNALLAVGDDRSNVERWKRHPGIEPRRESGPTLLLPVVAAVDPLTARRRCSSSDSIVSSSAARACVRLGIAIVSAARTGSLMLPFPGRTHTASPVASAPGGSGSSRALLVSTPGRNSAPDGFDPVRGCAPTVASPGSCRYVSGQDECPSRQRECSIQVQDARRDR